MQDTLGKLAASLAATEGSLAEARAETRSLDDAMAAAEKAAAAAQQAIQVRLCPANKGRAATLGQSDAPCCCDVRECVCAMIGA